MAATRITELLRQQLAAARAEEAAARAQAARLERHFRWLVIAGAGLLLVGVLAPMGALFFIGFTAVLLLAGRQALLLNDADLAVNDALIRQIHLLFLQRALGEASSPAGASDDPVA